MYLLAGPPTQICYPLQVERLLLSAQRQDLVPKPSIKVLDQSVLYIAEVSAKKVYRAILPSKLTKVSSQAKWDELYPPLEADSKGKWEQVYTFPYLATRETKLQSLQFRITHRTIPCNRYLSNIRIKQDDSCSYCEPPVSDTIQHFFFSCTKVTTFWDSVTLWLATQANFHFTITEEHFLLGVPNAVPKARNHTLGKELHAPKIISQRKTGSKTLFA